MGTKASILLVDDQLEFIHFLEVALKVEGYNIFTARNGFAALEVMETYPIDLVISDVAMPHLNGYQLYQRIRKNPRWLHVSFLLMSGRDMDSDIRFGKELGVDDYLTKPIELDDVLAIIRGRLTRSRQLAEMSIVKDTTEAHRFSAGTFEIDFEQHAVWHNEKPVNLSVKEYHLLRRLILQANEVIPLSTLVESTHDFVADPIEAGALLRPLIRSLRRKLGFSAGEMGCIENVRGVGYRLIITET